MCGPRRWRDTRAHSPNPLIHWPFCLDNKILTIAVFTFVRLGQYGCHWRLCLPMLCHTGGKLPVAHRRIRVQTTEKRHSRLILKSAIGVQACLPSILLSASRISRSWKPSKLTSSWFTSSLQQNYKFGFTFAL